MLKITHEKHRNWASYIRLAFAVVKRTTPEGGFRDHLEKSNRLEKRTSELFSVSKKIRCIGKNPKQLD